MARSMSQDIERAWAAGFFDGEGCTSYVRTGRGEHVIAMSIGQTSADGCPEVLSRFLSAVVMGKIYGPTQQRSNWTPKYTWQVTGRLMVMAVYALLAPYLSNVKREQYQKSLAAFDAHPMARDKVPA